MRPPRRRTGRPNRRDVLAVSGEAAIQLADAVPTNGDASADLGNPPAGLRSAVFRLADTFVA